MTPGHALTLWTVRVACVLYAGAAAAWLVRRPAAARIAWTSGCALYLVHVAAAFNFYHGWSHDAAYRDTARQTAELFSIDWGGGLYFNYVFTAIWVLDVCWMWARPGSYSKRPSWIPAAIHGFMAFLFFNATVVFGSAPARWGGLAVSALLLHLLAGKLRAGSRIGVEVPGNKLNTSEKEAR